MALSLQFYKDQEYFLMTRKYFTTQIRAPSYLHFHEIWSFPASFVTTTFCNNFKQQFPEFPRCSAEGVFWKSFCVFLPFSANLSIACFFYLAEAARCLLNISSNKFFLMPLQLICLLPQNFFGLWRWAVGGYQNVIIYKACDERNRYLSSTNNFDRGPITQAFFDWFFSSPNVFVCAYLSRYHQQNCQIYLVQIILHWIFH